MKKRQQAVSIDEIAETALRILDDEGLDALTMRRLASEMGVQPVTLYRYLPDKEAILAVVADRLWAQLLVIPEEGKPWRQRVRAAWLNVHELMQRHPHATPMIARAGTYSVTASAATSELILVLRDADFPPDLAADLMHAIGATVVGFAFATLWQRLEAEGRRPSIPAGEAGPLAEGIGEYMMRMTPWSSHQFEETLDMLLDGFETKLRLAGAADSK